MKLFNKVLLSAISIVTISNSISYSMDNPIRNINGTNYQYNTYNLTEQEKTNINNNISQILNDIKTYSNSSLTENTFHLNNWKIKLQNQTARIEEINNPIIDTLIEMCFTNCKNNFLTLSTIKEENKSIDNLKNRIETVEKKLKIQYDEDDAKQTKTDYQSKNNTINIINNNAINSMNIINDNYVNSIINIDKNINDILNLKVDTSIYDLLNKFISGSENDFLSNVIKLAKDYYGILKSNIDQNNILIEEVKQIAKNLYDKYVALYLKTNYLKKFIDSTKNKAEKLDNQIEEHTKKMTNLQKRFYKIIKRLNKNIDVNKERRTLIGGIEYKDFETEVERKENKLKKSNILKKTNKLDEIVRNAEVNLINCKKEINNNISELNKNYKFKSKYYVIDRLKDMKSMLFDANYISIENGTILRKMIDEIESFTNYKNIDLLQSEVKNVNSTIISHLNTVSNYLLSIKAIQDSMCNIECNLGIKLTITKKYENTKYENQDLKDENKNLKDENNNLKNENKNLHLKNKTLSARLTGNNTQDNVNSFSPLISNNNNSLTVNNFTFNNDNGIKKENNTNNKYFGKKRNREEAILDFEDEIENNDQYKEQYNGKKKEQCTEKNNIKKKNNTQQKDLADSDSSSGLSFFNESFSQDNNEDNNMNGGNYNIEEK